MGMFARTATDCETVAAEVERETMGKELVSCEVAEPQRQLPIDGEMAARKLGLLLQRMSADSARQIDGLISDLEVLRERLQPRDDRTANVVFDYAGLNAATTRSIRIIAEYRRYFEKRSSRSKRQRMIASR